MACNFCNHERYVYGEYERYYMRIVHIVPLPAINLTTGEKEKKAGNPYYSLFMYDEADCDRCEVESFNIKFCPLCGQRLGGNN